jgi:hypothetical protein
VAVAVVVLSLVTLSVLVHHEHSLSALVVAVQVLVGPMVGTRLCLVLADGLQLVVVKAGRV